MSDAVSREWRFYIDDMISFAGKVIAYTEGLDQAAFIGGGLNYDATVRNLELIGEAATHIPETIFPRCWKSLMTQRPVCPKAAGD